MHLYNLWHDFMKVTSTLCTLLTIASNPKTLDSCKKFFQISRFHHKVATVHRALQLHNLTFSAPKNFRHVLYSKSQLHKSFLNIINFLNFMNIMNFMKFTGCTCTYAHVQCTSGLLGLTWMSSVSRLLCQLFSAHTVQIASTLKLLELPARLLCSAGTVLLRNQAYKVQAITRYAQWHAQVVILCRMIIKNYICSAWSAQSPSFLYRSVTPSWAAVNDSISQELTSLSYNIPADPISG